jgi:hypothetical protein
MYLNLANYNNNCNIISMIFYRLVNESYDLHTWPGPLTHVALYFVYTAYYLSC